MVPLGIFVRRTNYVNAEMSDVATLRRKVAKLATLRRKNEREGNRPPFIEDPDERAARMHFNGIVKQFQGDNVIVIDIEPLFSTDAKTVRFVDRDGNQLYQDTDHLSTVKADLVRADLISAMIKRKPQL